MPQNSDDAYSHSGGRGALARLVAEVLGREGYAAEAVGDGRAALARALVEPFDPKPEPFETGTGA